MTDTDAAPPPPDPRGRVLIVDDEPTVLEVLVAMLSEAGWQVDAAPNGHRALGLVDANQYEVVLSDIDMPGIDGVQLLREIRGRDLDVPVLLITGHPRVDTAVEALEHGLRATPADDARRTSDTSPTSVTTLPCLAFARSSASNSCGVGSAGTERTTPPAIRKPKAWIG